MSYIDTIILGYIVNLILYVLSIIFGLVVGFINIGLSSSDYIFRVQKARMSMQELKEKMTPEQTKTEKQRTFAPLLLPFGMVIPAFRISYDVIMTRFDLVDMSYISMQRMKERYHL